MRLTIFLLAALLSAALAPVVRRLAVRLGAQDDPSARRKVHRQLMPRLGGLAILAATLLTVGAGLLLAAEGTARILELPEPIIGLAIAAIVTATFGLIDDLYDVRPWLVLIAELVSAGIVWLAGFRIEALDLAGHTFDLGWFALPVTMLWFVAVMNALNLVDGLDGLAASQTLLALGVLVAQALLTSGPVAIVVAVALAGGVAGFLIENLYPARQFMGTCGSLLLGLLLAALAVGTLRGKVGMNPVIPLLAFGVPLLDLALAFVRRVVRGRSPLSADRGHLHHRLLNCGYSQGAAVWVLFAVQAIFASLALLALVVPERLSLLPLFPGAVVGIAFVLWLRRAQARAAESTA